MVQTHNLNVEFFNFLVFLSDLLFELEEFGLGELLRIHAIRRFGSDAAFSVGLILLNLLLTYFGFKSGLARVQIFNFDQQPFASVLQLIDASLRHKFLLGQILPDEALPKTFGRVIEPGLRFLPQTFWDDALAR